MFNMVVYYDLANVEQGWAEIDCNTLRPALRPQRGIRGLNEESGGLAHVNLYIGGNSQSFRPLYMYMYISTEIPVRSRLPGTLNADNMVKENSQSFFKHSLT